MSGRALRWLLALGHRPRAAASRLVVIRHHRVYREGERPLYRLGIGERVLADQLAMLRALRLEPLTVSEGLARLAAGEAGPRVAMSFDDGYADNVERALPLLRAHGARATFYLTAGLIEERRAPWWDELVHALETSPRRALPANGRGRALRLGDRVARARALRALLPGLRLAPAAQHAALAALREGLAVTSEAPCALATWAEAARLAEAGMEIGAHTLTHPFLSLLPPEEQAREIGGSAGLIERRLGLKPAGLAYPGGDYDAASVVAAVAAGLEHAVTTRAGDNDAASPRFELRRRGLSEGSCLGPGGRFSRQMARAELDGAFDRLRLAGRAT